MPRPLPKPRSHKQIQIYLYERDQRVNEPRAVNTYRSTPPGIPSRPAKTGAAARRSASKR